MDVAFSVCKSTSNRDFLMHWKLSGFSLYLLAIIVTVIFPAHVLSEQPVATVTDPPPGNAISKLEFPQLSLNAGHLGCRVNAVGRAVPRLVRGANSVALRKRLRNRAQRARANGTPPHRIAKIRQTVRKRLNIPRHRTLCEAALSQPENFVAPLPSPVIPSSPEPGKTICEAADFNNNGYVDVKDLHVLLNQWGQSNSPADLNGDGTVDATDLLILIALWGPVAECSSGGYTPAGCGEPNYDPWDNLHDFTGLPMTCDGWSDFLAMYQHPELYTDTRIIYVSNSEGSDSSGVTYLPGHPAVGDDPFSPVGNIQPFQTIAEAYEQLRDGYADILLLKRGDTWDESLSPASSTRWRRSGKSQLEPMIVGAYGPQSENRPVLKPQERTLYVLGGDNQQDYLVFSGFQIYAAHKDPDSPDFISSNQPGSGIFWLSGGASVLFEDLYLRFNGITLQGWVNPINNVALRRSVVERSYSLEGHAQGIYASENTAPFDGLLIEESVFDHNGWHEALEGAEATVFNRNMYLSQVTNVITRGNIDARGASGGIQQRRGGLCEFNLSLSNPIAFTFGHPENEPGSVTTGTIRHNLVMDALYPGTVHRGFGIEVGGGYGNDIVVQDVEVSNNLIVNGAHASANVRGINIEAPGTIVENNIVYNWWQMNAPHSWGAYGHALQMSSSAIDSIVVGNTFYQPQSGFVLRMNDGTVPVGTQILSNFYYSANNPPHQVQYSGAHIALSDWLNITTEENTEPSHLFPDPDILTIGHYLGSLGMPDEELENFLNYAKANRRGNWNSNYTAYSVLNWTRAQFGLAPVEPSAW